MKFIFWSKVENTIRGGKTPMKRVNLSKKIMEEQKGKNL